MNLKGTSRMPGIAKSLAHRILFVAIASAAWMVTINTARAQVPPQTPPRDASGVPSARPGVPAERPGVPAESIPAPGATLVLSGTTSIAVMGEPFGVGRIDLSLATPVTAELLPPIEAIEKDGRIFYPSVRNILAPPRVALRTPPPAPGEPRVGGGRLLRRVGDLVRQASADESVPLVVSRELTFVFRGSEPLEINVSEPDAAGRTDFVVIPTKPAVRDDHSVAMNRWWSSFTEEMRQQSDAADYPAIVENYLTASLGGRLGLALPADFIVDSTIDEPSMMSTLNLVAGTEKVRAAIFRRAAMGTAEPVQADLPLPESPHWSPAAVSLGQGAVNIEPLASRVPPECFYIRYGSFENYLWFRDLSEEYGGDVGRMFTIRGSNDGSARRVEAQLNLKTTALSRMLGSSVIEDQAIIGRDLFLSEGASLGVLFRTKNTFLLQTSLNSDRTSLASSDPEVKLTTETIRDRPVSFLHTDDNRVRSFLVVDGDTVLVTNSHTLVERFLEVKATGESLAATPEFQLARQLMPLEREDTLFAYFSPGMLRGLVSPSYLIEMRRRLFASSDLALVRLARLAAAAEGKPLDAPEDLVAAGYLPANFLSRGDGSGVLAVGDVLIDSLRGRPGTLLPIADVKIDAVTAGERDWYTRIASFHENQWQQLDPLIVGVRRTSVDGAPSLERLEIRAEVAPLVSAKYGNIAKQLGPPTRVKIDFAPDDIVAAQAHVASDQLGGSIPPHHLFAAIKDTTPPSPDQFSGLLQTYQALRALPGYLGAWPQPGLLDRLPLGIGRGQVVGPGLTRLIGGVYRYQGGGFSIVSLQSDVLLASLPFLAATEADDLAQVRVRVGNLRGSQLEGWVNDQMFQKSIASSRAGASFLSLLSRKLRIPPDDAKAVADSLLGGRLQDPLGGNYVRVRAEGADVAGANNRGRWVSDAWVDEPRRPLSVMPRQPVMPPDYVAPVLQWFRGGRAELTQFADRLVVNTMIDVQRRGTDASKPVTIEPAAAPVP